MSLVAWPGDGLCDEGLKVDGSLWRVVEYLTLTATTGRTVVYVHFMTTLNLQMKMLKIKGVGGCGCGCRRLRAGLLGLNYNPGCDHFCSFMDTFGTIRVKTKAILNSLVCCIPDRSDILLFMVSGLCLDNLCLWSSPQETIYLLDIKHGQWGVRGLVVVHKLSRFYYRPFFHIWPSQWERINSMSIKNSSEQFYVQEFRN